MLLIRSPLLFLTLDNVGSFGEFLFCKSVDDVSKTILIIGAFTTRMRKHYNPPPLTAVNEL